MANQRFQRHPSSGPPKAKSGVRHDTVGPMKTKNWPGLPGATQRKPRNAGIKKMHHGPADKGL